MSEKIGILVDLGNSETRVSIVRNNVYEDMVFSNRFVKLEAKYNIPKEYRNEQSTIFKYNGASYANGAIVTKEFPSTKFIKPYAGQPKTGQLSTGLTWNLIFIRTLLYLSKISNTPIEDLDVIFDIRMLLPPSEHDKRSEDVKADIMKLNEVTVFVPTKVKKEIKVNSIIVLPEGATAYIGCVYRDVNGQLTVVPENEPFTTGDVLVIDIGAGTTDIVNIKDTELVVSSKETIKQGGNIIESDVKQRIYKEYEYIPDDVAMRKVLETGMLEKGMDKIPVDDKLRDAKEQLGFVLKNFLMEYLDRSAIDIHSIKGILVVGGGALPTTRDGEIVAPPMSDVLLNFINEMTASAHLVDLCGRSPRNLNLEGLKIYYKFIC